MMTNGCGCVTGENEEEREYRTTEGWHSADVVRAKTLVE